MITWVSSYIYPADGNRAIESSPPQAFDIYIFYHKGQLGNWEWARRRERELVTNEERKHMERWEEEKEGKCFLSFPCHPAHLLIS